MSQITTHVLDTARGAPAAGVPVTLDRMSSRGVATRVAHATTDDDGRVRDLLPDGVPFEAGTYRLVFATGAYFALIGAETFYPEVSVVFQVRDPGEHHHVPLLLSPFGYSTYRGS